jgi:hypothetical protein
MILLFFRLLHDHRNQLGNINPRKLFQAVKMSLIMNHHVQLFHQLKKKKKKKKGKE